MPFLPACFSPLRIFSLSPKKIAVTPVSDHITPTPAAIGKRIHGLPAPPRRRHQPSHSASPSTRHRPYPLRVHRRQSSRLIKKENVKKAFHRQNQKATRRAGPAVAPALLSQLAKEKPVAFETMDQAVSSLLLSGADVPAEDLIMAQQLKALAAERSIHKRIDDERDLVERARKDAPAMTLAREKKTAMARKAKVRAAAEAVEESKKKREARYSAAMHLRQNPRISHGMRGRVNVEKRQSRFRLPRGSSRLTKARREAEGLAHIRNRLQEEARIHAARAREEALEAERQAAFRRQEEKRQAVMRAEEARREAEYQAHIRWVEEQQRIRQAQEAAELARRQEEARLQAQRLEQERLQVEKIANEQRFLNEYDLKWNVLKTDQHIPVIYFYEVPWPLATQVQSFDDFTISAISHFVLHPLRTSLEGKTPRERIKAEMLRWHPDKFNLKVLPRIYPDHIESTKDAAGRVVRILMEMLRQHDN